MKWLLCLLLLASCTLEVGVPDSIYLYPRGRVSEPSPNVAPRGSLLRAENCVMREPGVLSPVPDLQAITGNGAPTDAYIDQFSPLFENGSSPQFLCHFGRTGEFFGTQSGVHASGSLGVEVTYTDPDGSSASIEYYDHGDGLTAFPMWLARDNLYLADKRGVYKWESTDDTNLIPVWDGSNVLMNGAATSAASGTWLPINEHVRYAAVVVYEDSNGVIRRSAPTLSGLVDNDTGGDAYVSLAVLVLNDEAERDDFSHVEIYRTRSYANTVTPPNEFYLAGTLDESDLAANSDFNLYQASFSDTQQDDLLSTAMYTSSSQGGAAAANISPPSGVYHAHFRGHEFWADVAEKEFFDPLLRVDDADADHRVTGSIVITSGSDEVTGVTDLNGAQIGMLVDDFSSGTQRFPAGTYITAISGSTVTMSENATSSGSDAFSAYDTAFVRWGDGSTDRFAIYSFQTFVRLARTASSVYATFDIYDDSEYDVSMRIASKHRVSRMGAAQLWVSNPGEYENYAWADLNTASGAPTSGGTAAKPALHRRRIAWSKFQEPEVTTLTNSTDVGGPGDIVGLGALRDCLIILKTDGVYKLTGSNGNWRIDPIDTSVRVIGGRSTQVMGNAVYTLSDRGILRVTANRVSLLSDNVVNDWFKEDEELLGEPRLEDLRRYMADNDGYHPITLFSGADEFHQEYVLCCEGSDTPYSGASSSFLVYNASTSAFTTWNIADDTKPVGALGYARGNTFNFGNQSPGIVLSREYSDADASPALHILDSRQDTKDAGYSEFTQDIAFRSLHEGDPTTLKIWREFVWDAESSSAAKTAVFQRSERDSEVTQSIPSGETDEIRVWPPIEVARSSKPVVGIRGTGITIRGLRATFSASGRGVPLE